MDPHLLVAAAEGCGPQCIGALLDPGLDLAAALADPSSVELPPAVAARLRARDRLTTTAQAWRRDAHAAGASIVTPADDAYPRPMRDAPLRPLSLFVRGAVGVLDGTRVAVAIVGSRTPTPYGEAATADFTAALSTSGVVVWSGLAAGVDGVAHRVAVQSHAPTVAVLAGGLDRIYPRVHEPLAAAIVSGGGALITEAPFGRRATRGHFPRRNRILGTAVHAVLVVEAGLASGTMYTARFAAEVGVPVFAVPGPYTSPRSRGCHELIAEGAQVARDPDDLLRRLRVETDAQRTATDTAHDDDVDRSTILRLLASGPRPGDLVARESRLAPDRFGRAMLDLVAAGRVIELPGDLFAARGPRDATVGSRRSADEQPAEQQHQSDADRGLPEPLAGDADGGVQRAPGVGVTLRGVHDDDEEDDQ